MNFRISACQCFSFSAFSISSVSSAKSVVKHLALCLLCFLRGFVSQFFKKSVVKFLFCFLVCLSLLSGSVSLSQEVLAPPPPEFSQQSPAFGPTLENSLAEPLAPINSTAQNLLSWGPIQLRPHLLYRLSYGNGIQSRPGEQSKTFINEIDPGMLFDIGEHWHRI